MANSLGEWWARKLAQATDQTLARVMAQVMEPLVQVMEPTLARGWEQMLAWKWAQTVDQMLARVLAQVTEPTLGRKSALLLELGLQLLLLPLLVLVKLLAWLERLVRNALAPRENPMITLLSHCLRARERVEWIGDLYEIRQQWQGQGLSRWSTDVRTFAVALQLLWAQLRCTVYDHVFARYWEKS